MCLLHTLEHPHRHPSLGAVECLGEDGGKAPSGRNPETGRVGAEAGMKKSPTHDRRRCYARQTCSGEHRPRPKPSQSRLRRHGLRIAPPSPFRIAPTAARQPKKTPSTLHCKWRNCASCRSRARIEPMQAASTYPLSTCWAQACPRRQSESGFQG